MAFELSFAEEFFWGDGSPGVEDKTSRPTSVVQALYSMPKKRWNEMCREVFNRKPDFVDVETVMAKIAETNTCSNLDSPVTVWIDEEGFYTVDVYDSRG